MKHKINLNQFEEIQPEANRLTSRFIGVNASGQVSLSTPMRKALEEMGWDRVMLLTNAKGSMVLIRQAGKDENGYNIPKNSAIAAANFTRSMQKRGVKLSVRYLMDWDETIGMWVGSMDNSRSADAKGPMQPPAKFPELREIV